MTLFLIFFMALGGVYLDSTKVDKETLQVVVEANLERQAEIQAVLGEIRGEQKSMAKYWTGQESFKEHDLERYPPQQYILDCDSCADRIPAGGYDSCIVGIITDAEMKRLPWYCYIKDSIGKPIIAEFR